MWLIHSLFLFGFASTAVSQTNQKRLNVFNVTEPIGKILENATLTKLFIETLAQQNVQKGQPLFLLYDLNGDTLTDCIEKFSEGEKILSAIGNRTDVDLILSITLNSWNETEDLEGFKWMSKSSAKLLVNFHKSTQCSEFRKYSNFFENLLPKIKPWIPGIGYDESLISCGNVEYNFFMPFVVVHLALKETAGVAESYSLFRRRMSHLHSSQQEFLKKLVSKFPSSNKPITLYSISKQFLDDNCHQRLLASFVDKWSYVDAQGKGKFVQAAYLQSLEHPISNGFLMNNKGLLHRIPNARTTPQVLSQYFDSVFIPFDNWKRDLKDKLQGDALKHNLTTYSNKKLGLFIILGITKDIQKAELEIDEWIAADPCPNVFVSTLLIQMQQNITEIDKTVVEAVNRMSSKIAIGCRIWQDKELKRTYPAAAELIKTCQKINSSLYVLGQNIDLQRNDVDSREYSYGYENVIRKELNKMKIYGELILDQHPTSRIIYEPHLVRYYEDDNNRATNFCSDEILYYNEYHEAIINWANCNNVEVVPKSAIGQIEYVGFEDWLSYLRPISVNSYDIHKLAESYPYVVLRNYPKNINNWKVDPCVNWETARPTIKANYFQNKFVGAVFYPDQINQNKQLTVEEYVIMLQFVINKFSVAEVVLQTSIKNFFVAYNWIETKSDVIDANKLVLLNYRIPQTAKANMLVNSEKTLLSLFDELKENRWKSIQRIHFEFLTNDSSCLDYLSHPILTFLAENKIESVKFGILVDYRCCMTFVEFLVFNNASSQPILMLLNQIEYLVCQEKHQIRFLTYQKTMGHVLDSQLYLKKAYQEFSPHLELYFRVTLTDLSPHSIEYSDDYMKTVSHFMQSATAYNISYLIIQAFDEETSKGGWWRIEDFNNLSDPLTFVEKEAEASNQITWRPDALKFETYADSDINPYVLAASVIGVGLILCVSVSTFFYLRYKKLSQFLSDEEVREFVNGGSNGTQAASTNASGGEAEYMKFNTEYKLHISDLHLDIQTILGKGNFGTVYKGTVKETPAAIKTPNKNCSKTTFKSVLCEVKVLCYIGEHSNIVGFLGAYTNEIQRGVLYIATEFCANGSLEAFLRKKTNVVASQDEHALLTIPERECALFVEDLCRFSIEVASGMEHLEEKHVVHGDLSVRNVLLDENYTCKIADFGLSRKLYDYQKYVKTSQEPLPWKWMAYESLTKMEFTSKSDVWSYGVTVWEIFSLGKIPYCTVNWTLDYPDQLKNGLRLSKPDFASQEIYMKLLACWNLNPGQRPTFAEMSCFFKEMDKTEYVVLDEVENGVM